MTTNEEIEAAIMRLNKLRDESTPYQYRIVEEVNGDRYLGSFWIGESNAPESIPAQDANLIVTLYRTIDAQLEVLSDGAQAIADRDALTDVYAWDDGDWSYNTSTELVALLFARAINGTIDASSAA